MGQGAQAEARAALLPSTLSHLRPGAAVTCILWQESCSVLLSNGRPPGPVGLRPGDVDCDVIQKPRPQGLRLSC